jgi:hypothetical protein
VDLGAGAALVVAVAPLGEVGLQPGLGREAGQLAGDARALERAGQHQRELLPRQRGV